MNTSQRYDVLAGAAITQGRTTPSAILLSGIVFGLLLGLPLWGLYFWAVVSHGFWTATLVPVGVLLVLGSLGNLIHDYKEA